jgi:small acid-soluble spore protein E (minor gamma-type SASP)
MANFNNQPNKTQAGTNFQGGQFGTEFASQTDAAEVRRQNQQSQSAGGNGGNEGFGTEFASETNAAEVRRQNQQSQGNVGQGNNNRQS